MPYNADDNEHEIQDNDIIVMASDGVFDNLYDLDTKTCVKKSVQGTHLGDPKEAADCIANLAFDLGNKKGYLSPFAKGAHEANINFPNQGKADDIVAIVAQIHVRGKGPEGSENQRLSTNGIGLAEHYETSDTKSTTSTSASTNEDL